MLQACELDLATYQPLTSSSMRDNSSSISGLDFLLDTAALSTTSDTVFSPVFTRT